MRKIIIFLLLSVLAGCSTLRDTPKGVAGVSTKVMEDARTKAIFQSYQCDISECFQAVLDIAKDQKYYVFLQDEVRGLIVLMNIPGVVDTTEVGVFLTPAGGKSRPGVKVEISSRSSPAKRKVAQDLLSELSQRFSKL